MRPGKSTEARDFAESFLALGLGAPLALAANVVFARLLGVQSFGTYMTLLSAALVCSGFAAHGVGPVLTRHIAGRAADSQAHSARRILRWATRFTLKTGAISVGFLWLWMTWLPGAPRCSIEAKLLAAGVVLPAVWVIIGGAGLAGFMRVPQSQALSNVVKNGLLLIAGVGALRLAGGTPEAALLAQVFSTVCAAALGFYWLRPLLGPTATPRVHASKEDAPLLEWRRAAGHFFSMSLATMFLSRLDVIVVNAFSNTAEAGLFAAAARLAQIAQLVGLAWLNWLRPRVARSVGELDFEQTRKILRWGMLGVAGMASSVTVAAWFGAPVLAMMFGASFAPAQGPFRILLIANLAWCLSVPAYTFMTMAGAERFVSRIIWAQLFVTVLAGGLLCRHLGALGAAWGWMGGAVLASFTVVVFGWRSLSAYSHVTSTVDPSSVAEPQ